MDDAIRKHGTETAYRKHRCRCLECKRWKRDKSRKDALKKRVFVSGQCINSQCDVWFITTGIRSRKYCSPQCAHQAKHARRYEPLRKGQRSSNEVVDRDDRGRKRCFRCHAWLEESAFSRAPHTSDGLHTRCRRCHSDAQHGLSVERRERMLSDQQGMCATCDFAFEVHGNKKTTYQVDHDHECCPSRHSCGQCIRGLLCGTCNKLDTLAYEQLRLIG